jgi:hypothetical protein
MFLVKENMMRSLAIIALIASLGLAPSVASAVTPPPPTAETQMEKESPDYIYPLVLAVGALIGVAGVNMLTYDLGTLPLQVGIETSAPMISPAVAAASRIYAITSAVIGAWIADWLYR